MTCLNKIDWIIVFSSQKAQIGGTPCRVNYSPAEGIRGSLDGTHRLTLKGECADGLIGLGEFLFFAKDGADCV